ncbi:MAG: hypothetical protein R3266_06100 [Gemmatimonadota bacterium]|nr:hypothetical protein [Gemmatimonadota bacterium]
MATAILLGGLAAAAMQPSVAGHFHDDGIYLATAKSIADGEGYRHASLPTTPVQTKYPPLYSTVMAGVWKIFPEHPANIVPLKATSALFLAVIVLLAGALGTRLLGGTVPPIAFAFLTGASPLVFSLTDYTMTELPFLALCLGAFLAARRDRAGEGRPTGNAIALGSICGLAFLVRQAAVPLIAAGVVVLAARRRWRSVPAFLGSAALFAVPWLWFKLAYADPDPNPLLAYYTTYEPSALELARTAPGLAFEIVLGNLRYLRDTLDLAAYTGSPALRFLFYPVFLVGLWRLFRRPLAFIPLFSVFYGGLILLWPWLPSRYAIPLTPLVPLAALLAGRWLAEKVDWSHETDLPGLGPRLARGLGRAAPWIPALLLAALATAWLAAYVPREPGTLRTAFLTRLDYEWTGFEETADWLRAYTPPDAVLATAFDGAYFLRTGRQGIRPWFHRPWTYFYPFEDPTVDLGTADEIRAALDELGASHLVVDPLGGFQEREAAARLFVDLLRGYRPPAYDGTAQLRFTSADLLHRVYELPRRVRHEDPATRAAPPSSSPRSSSSPAIRPSPRTAWWKAPGPASSCRPRRWSSTWSISSPTGRTASRSRSCRPRT